MHLDLKDLQSGTQRMSAGILGLVVREMPNEKWWKITESLSGGWELTPLNDPVNQTNPGE